MIATYALWWDVCLSLNPKSWWLALSNYTQFTWSSTSLCYGVPVNPFIPSEIFSEVVFESGNWDHSCYSVCADIEWIHWCYLAIIPCSIILKTDPVTSIMNMSEKYALKTCNPRNVCGPYTPSTFHWKTYHSMNWAFRNSSDKITDLREKTSLVLIE